MLFNRQRFFSNHIFVAALSTILAGTYVSADETIEYCKKSGMRIVNPNLTCDPVTGFPVCRYTFRKVTAADPCVKPGSQSSNAGGSNSSAGSSPAQTTRRGSSGTTQNGQSSGSAPTSTEQSTSIANQQNSSSQRNTNTAPEDERCANDPNCISGDKLRYNAVTDGPVQAGSEAESEYDYDGARKAVAQLEADRLARLNAAGGAGSTNQDTPVTTAGSTNVTPGNSTPTSPSTSNTTTSNNTAASSDVSSGTTSDLASAAGADKPTRPVHDPGWHYNYKKHIKGGEDECSVGTTLDSRFSCGSTRTFIDTAKIANVAGQAIGSAAQQVMGAQSQMRMMQDGVSQSGALKNAAEMQMSGAQMQTAIGAANTAAGVYELYKSFEHKKNKDELTKELNSNFTAEANAKGQMYGDGRLKTDKGYITSGQKLGTTAIEKFQLNNGKGTQLYSERLGQLAAVVNTYPAGTPQHTAALTEYNALLKRKTQHVEGAVNDIGSHAAQEQAKIQRESMDAGVQSTVMGLSQLIQGSFNMQAAKLTMDAADKMQAAANTGPQFAPITPNNTWNNADPLAPRSPTTIRNSQPESQAAVEEEKGMDEPGLGAPLAPMKNDGLVGTPPGAAKFVAKDPPAGGGGGGGGVSGASTSPASGGSGEEPSARLADNRGAPGYEGGGSYGSGGGMAATAGGGPDLSGLLAKFLPNKEEEQAKNNILDYGGRAPASDENGSLLDRNANLFERIHNAYQEKQRKRGI